MRVLNLKERRLIRQVVNQETFRFRELFSATFMSNIKLAIMLKPRDVKVFLSPSVGQGRDIVKEMVFVIGLIKLLEKNDLILTFKLDLTLQNQTFGDLNTQGIPQPKFLFGDDSLKQEIARYVFAEFFVTEELRRFVARGFTTQEEIRHRQVMVGSWFAIFVAAATSIYAIWRQEAHDEDRRALMTRIEVIEAKMDSIQQARRIPSVTDSLVTDTVRTW